MAHELVATNGMIEAMYAQSPAWHRLGQVLDHVPTSREAMKAAHLDWTVEKEEISTRHGIVPNFYATVRQDTHKPLGIVKEDYSVVQNIEAFDFLDGLVKDGNMLYESCGALKGGKVIWVLGRMPSYDVIAEGDSTLRYILFKTSHDGTTGVVITPTSVRVVCANTLKIATKGVPSIRHTGDMKSKLDFMHKYASQWDSEFVDFRDQARKLVGRRLKKNDTVAKDYINELFPIPEDATERMLKNRETIIDSVRHRYRNKNQMLPSIEGTMWALFNAVTEHVDHDRSFRGTGMDREENRFISVMDGAQSEFKQKAFTLALSLSA